MFFVNIEPSLNNPKVKDIEFIYHTRVKIEDPKKTNEIVQCTRCQQYGHTKNNCMRPYRCVKCAGEHKTTDCPKKDRNTPATCALCFGDHPANYKGCQVYKEIRARKTTWIVNNKTKPVVQNTLAKPPPIEEYPPLKTQINTGQKINSQLNNTHNPSNALTYLRAAQHSNRITEDIQPQPTNKLEEIIIKQSEKIDILIQQMGTLLGLLTTLIAQQQK